MKILKNIPISEVPEDTRSANRRKYQELMKEIAKLAPGKALVIEPDYPSQATHIQNTMKSAFKETYKKYGVVNRKGKIYITYNR